MAQDDKKIVFGVELDTKEIKRAVKQLEKEFAQFKGITKLFKRGDLTRGNGDLAWLKKNLKEVFKPQTVIINKGETKKHITWLRQQVKSAFGKQTVSIRRAEFRKEISYMNKLLKETFAKQKITIDRTSLRAALKDLRQAGLSELVGSTTARRGSRGASRGGGREGVGLASNLNDYYNDSVISSKMRKNLELQLQTIFERLQPADALRASGGFSTLAGRESLARRFGDFESGIDRVDRALNHFAGGLNNSPIMRQIQSARTVEDYNNLRQSLFDMRQESNRVASAQRTTSNELRRSNALMRRFNSSFLQYAAGGVSAFAVAGGVGSVLQTAQMNMGLESAYTAIFKGDTGKAAEEIKFIEEVSGRIGINFQDAAEGHRNLLANLQSKVGVEKTRELSQSIFEVSRVLNLNQEDVKGSIRA